MQKYLVPLIRNMRVQIAGSRSEGTEIPIADRMAVRQYQTAATERARCYGVNGGGAWSDGPSMTYVDLANVGNTTNAYAPSTVNPSSSTSGLVGFHAGYNMQIAPTWVLGIEGDWDWTNINAGGTNNLFGATNNAGGTFGLLRDNVTLQTKVDWLASVRGRLGYASSNWMLYGTGGVAFADMKYNAQVNCVGPVNGVGTLCGAPGQNIRPTGFNNTRVGWVAGAGFEYKPVSNRIFGLEYLYYRFDDTDTGGGSFTFRTERRLRSTHAPRRDRIAPDFPTAI